jgi:hypothetical protein
LFLTCPLKRILDLLASSSPCLDGFKFRMVYIPVGNWLCICVPYGIQILNNRINIPNLTFFFKLPKRFPCIIRLHILRDIDINRIVISPGCGAPVRDKRVYLVLTSEPLCEIAAFTVHFKGVY